MPETTNTSDRGPLLAYEITWISGHVETIHGHQVIMPMPQAFGLSDDFPRRIMFHGEIDGRWQLILAADEADVRTIRNVTVTEASP